MKFTKIFVLFTAILAAAAASIPNSAEARSPAVCLTSGARVSGGGSVTFCGLAEQAPGQAASKVTVKKLVTSGGSTAEKTVFSTLTSGTNLSMALAGMGSGDFEMTAAALSGMGAVLDAETLNITFSVDNNGPNLNYIPSKRANPGDSLSFGALVTGPLPTDARFSLRCIDVDEGNFIPCPSGMNLNAISGQFTFASPLPIDIYVVITVTSSAGSDSQLFRIIVAPDVCVTEGCVNDIAPLLTPLEGFIVPDPVIPNAEVADSSAPDHSRALCVDSKITKNETWVPTDENNWFIKIKIDEQPGQRMYLVDNIRLNFGMYAGAGGSDIGSSIPDTSMPGQLTLAYSTSPTGANETFIPISTEMYLDPLNDQGIIIFGEPFCTSIDPDCEGRIDLGQSARYLLLSGTGVKPALEEVSIFGWRGEVDCDPSDDSIWRRWAYRDTNGDCIPDELVQIACYGETAPPPYIAPEDVTWTACRPRGRGPS